GRADLRRVQAIQRQFLRPGLDDMVDRLVVVGFLLAKRLLRLMHEPAELLELALVEGFCVALLRNVRSGLLDLRQALSQMLEGRWIISSRQVLGLPRRDLLAHLLDRTELLAE